MNNGLEESINNLYKVFSKYKKPLSFPTCECCVSEKEMEFLLSKSLTDLNADELAEYTFDVLGTVGGEEDFKYFFPRILELHTTE